MDDLERQNYLKIIEGLEKENDELLDIINEERYEKDENIIERKKVNHSIVSSSNNHQYEIKNVNISLNHMKKIYLTLCMSLFVTSAVLGSSTGYLLYKNQLLEEKLKREEAEDEKILDDFESCSNIRYQKLDLMIKDIDPIRLVGNHVEVEADKIAASINKYLESDLANGIEPGYDQIAIALVERFDKPYGTGEKNSDDIIRKICVKEGYKTVRDVANAYKYNYDVIGYEGFVKEANYRLLVSLDKIDINNLGGLSYARK